MRQMAQDWEHSAAVRETAEAFVVLGKRLDTYLEMLKAGFALCELAEKMRSVQLHQQAERIMDQFQKELEVRPLFEVITEEEMQ